MQMQTSSVFWRVNLLDLLQKIAQSLKEEQMKLSSNSSFSDVQLEESDNKKLISSGVCWWWHSVCNQYLVVDGADRTLCFSCRCALTQHSFSCRSSRHVVSHRQTDARVPLQTLPLHRRQYYTPPPLPNSSLQN